MKKIAKIFASTIIAVLIAFSFAACSNNIDGNYKAKSMIITTGEITLNIDYDNFEMSLNNALHGVELDDEMKTTFRNSADSHKNMNLFISDDKITSSLNEDGSNSSTINFRRDGDLLILLDNEGKDIADPNARFKVVKKDIEINIEILNITIKIVFIKSP